MSLTSESFISSLKDTLSAQQTLLQNLYDELDAEREASASAASEALSVIFRLQGQKAALKMEAGQYKRFSDVKMSHAEASLAVTEDIIYQREMEISGLESQVQAYRYKLSSRGCCVDFRDNPFQENKYLDTCSSFKNMDAGIESGDSCLRELDSMDTYSEQIRKLDARAKEIPNKVEFVSETKIESLQNGIGFDYPSSPRVHDVFEVPQIDWKSSSWESRLKDKNGMAIIDVEEKLYGEDRVENVLKSKELCGLSYEDSNECRLAIVRITTGSVSESRPGLYPLNGISGISENEKQGACNNRDEELKLLSEIKERLNSLHEEIRALKVEKSAKRDERSLGALSEAMLHFWI